jgi:hypothetical protein
MNLMKLKKLRFYLCFNLLFVSLAFNIKADYSFSSNGKSYEIITTRYSWTNAASNATTKGGYLVHIDSQTEQNTIYDAIVNGANISSTYVSITDGGGIAYIWIGANDKQSEGTWNWDGNNDGTGDNFWNGQGEAGDGQGSVVSGKFHNWGGKSQNTFPNEPDNYNSTQDASAIALAAWPYGTAGEWNDINETNQLYFIIEYDYSGKPGKASIPTGTVTLCQNSSDTQYSTSVVSEAVSYIWSLSPTSAGVINGSGTTITVDWNKDFSGNAELSVAAKNPVDTGDASDKLVITVNPRPVKCDVPKGPIEFCENPENTTYRIDGIPGISEYVWTISPTNAGVITGTTTEATVDWTNNFSSDVKISVAGVNECGTGEKSTDLIVKIKNKPLLPIKPTGPEKVVQNSYNTVYTTKGSASASSYKWKLLPSNSGIISGDSMSATVNWENDFAGVASVSVIGVNPCGESIESESLEIAVSNKPGKPDKPTGDTSLCQGTEKSIYSTNRAEGAINYNWKIIPANSAGIISDSNTVALLWNKDFAGVVEISVASVGPLELSDYSFILKVKINSKPVKSATPQGLKKNCNNSNNCEYKTTDNETFESYIWKLSPDNAGVITGNTSKILIDWTDTFIGKANLSVKGINECGTGDVSNSLEIDIVSTPSIPNKPTGKTSIGKSSSNIEYSTSTVEFADSYSWKLIPDNAGQISGNTNKAKVNLNTDFTGNVQISVNAKNSCGESQFSEMLQVLVSDTAQTSVENFIIQDNLIIIYPNPVSEIINIELNSSNPEIINIEIFDILGIPIKMINSTTNNNQINIEHLPAGIYYVKIGSIIKKFVKL